MSLVDCANTSATATTGTTSTNSTTTSTAGGNQQRDTTLIGTGCDDTFSSVLPIQFFILHSCFTELYIAAIAAGVSAPLVVIAAAITGISVVFIWKMKGMYSNSLHTYIYNATRISNGKYQHNKVR